MSKKITAFAGVFENRLHMMKKDLEKELSKPKADRSNKRLKSLLVDCKDMRDLVKELKPKCPHCGGDI